MEPIESEKQKVEYVTAEELVDFVTIKPDEDLPKGRLTEIIQRIDDVQDDLEFIRGWLKRHLEDANAVTVNSTVASHVRNDIRRASNYLQAVYRLLVKVMNNEEN